MRVCVLCVNVALTGRYVKWLPGAQLQCWMLLTVFTLPQLAVSAKILCLLMVIIYGAVPSMVRAVRLHSTCSHNYVNVLSNGTVMASYEPGMELKSENLTFSTRGASLDLLIYSPSQEMFLCFSGSKLIGRKISQAKAEKMDKCLFREEFMKATGYNRYRLANHPERYIGFNRNGMQIRRLKNRMRKNQQRCLDFMKRYHKFDIDWHNLKLGGLNKDLHQDFHKNPSQKLRHRHGLRRRDRDLT